MDRVVMQFPKNPREFFYAMAVSQGYIYEYVQEVSSRVRDPEFQFVYRLDERYSKYEVPLKVAANNNPIYDYSGWNQFARSEFQCFIEFDFERAKQLALNSGKHIVEAMGIMYGCTPRRWPILPPPACKEGRGILIIDWMGGGTISNEAFKLKRLIGNDNVNIIHLDDCDFERVEVETVEAIISPASELTYLASAYNRRVVEIFRTREEYDMYNNERMNYQAVIGNPLADDLFVAYSNIKPAEMPHESLLGQE